MLDLGVIHGRFQILHNDHLTYLMAGWARCRHLVVGVTNPDPTLTRTDEADPDRSLATANPLTYYERYQIIKAVLADQGLSGRDFSIVPLPISFPELFKYYVPLEAVFFLTIYDDWGEKKLRMFQSLGLKTEVLWRRPRAEKGLSATQIRDLMRRGGPWEDLVPAAAARLIKDLNLIQRLRQADQPGE